MCALIADERLKMMTERGQRYGDEGRERERELIDVRASGGAAVLRRHMAKGALTARNDSKRGRRRNT